MRLGSLILLTVLSAPLIGAAEQSLTLPSETAQTTSPSASTLPSSAATALELQLQLQTAEQKAQLQTLQHDNQQLRQQLKQALANSAPKPLISERQTWYLIGAGSTLLAVLIGTVLRGGRRTRREWLN